MQAITDGNMILVTFAGTPVCVGDTLLNHNGEPRVVKGGAAPRHAASSGRIYVKEASNIKPQDPGAFGGEYFPTVFGCKWVENNKG